MSRHARLFALALFLALALLSAMLPSNTLAFGSGGWVAVSPNPVVVHIGSSAYVPPGTTATITVTVWQPPGIALISLPGSGISCTITASPQACTVPIPIFYQNNNNYLLQVSYIGPGQRASHTSVWLQIRE